MLCKIKLEINKKKYLNFYINLKQMRKFSLREKHLCYFKSSVAYLENDQFLPLFQQLAFMDSTPELEKNQITKHRELSHVRQKGALLLLFCNDIIHQLREAFPVPTISPNFKMVTFYLISFKIVLVQKDIKDAKEIGSIASL